MEVMHGPMPAPNLESIGCADRGADEALAGGDGVSQ
jgi:hypothetical protein